MHVDPARLLVLHAVAAAGSVTGAARRLRVVPSGISQHLAALERETGLDLVDRSRRGGQRAVTLTASGVWLAERAAHLRAELDGIEQAIARSAEAVQGPVALAAFPTSLRHLVLPACERVAEAHPGVVSRIVQLDEAPALAALHTGAVDVAVVERDADAPVRLGSMAVEHLLDDRYLVAVPGSWPVPGSMHDLGDRDWIEGPPESVTAAVLDAHRRATGLAFHGAHACLEYPAVVELVDAGLGAALIPELAARTHPPGRARVTALPGLGGRALYAVCLRRRRSRAVVRAVLDALHEAADEVSSSARRRP